MGVTLKPLIQPPSDVPAYRWDPLRGVLAFASRAQQARQKSAAIPDLTTTSLQGFAERLQRMMGASGAAIAETRDNKVACIARSGTIGPSLGVSENHGFSADCISTGEALFCEDADSDAWVDREACRQIGVRSMVLVPVGESPHVLGILAVFSDRRAHFIHADLDAMRWAASILAPVLASNSRHNPTVNVQPLSARHETEITRESEPSPEPSAGPRLVRPVERTAIARKPRLLPRLALVLLVVLAGAYLQVRTSRQKIEVKAEQAVPPGPTPAPATEALPVPAEGATVPNSKADEGQAPVTDAGNLLRNITSSSDRERTLVAIETDVPVTYNIHRLSSPERIYLDLNGTHLSHAHSQDVPNPGDLRLAAIRVAQFEDDVTRVVLDLKKPVTYSISRDVNPHRLIVELRAVDSGVGRPPQ